MQHTHNQHATCSVQHTPSACSARSCTSDLPLLPIVVRLHSQCHASSAHAPLREGSHVWLRMAQRRARRRVRGHARKLDLSFSGVRCSIPQVKEHRTRATAAARSWSTMPRARYRHAAHATTHSRAEAGLSTPRHDACVRGVRRAGGKCGKDGRAGRRTLLAWWCVECRAVGARYPRRPRRTLSQAALASMQSPEAAQGFTYMRIAACGHSAIRSGRSGESHDGPLTGHCTQAAQPKPGCWRPNWPQAACAARSMCSKANRVWVRP